MSLGVHLTVVVPLGVASRWGGLLERRERPKFEIAQREPPVLYRERLGSPGEGEAFFERDDVRDQQVNREGREQPDLAELSLPRSAVPEVDTAAELASPTVPLPPAESSTSLAAALAPPPPEPDPEPPPPEEPQAAAVDDRDSPAVSPEPVATVDLRTGRTLSGGDLDFRPRLDRAGIGAYVDGAFLPSGTIVRMSIVIDGTGTPVQVVVTQSSGSRSVDELVEKSLFNWWFDPEGTTPGKPFTFGVRL